jgi:alkylation response protein AidB-like acyl-CoA dehydrogenase
MMSDAANIIFVPKHEHGLLIDALDQLLSQPDLIKDGWRPLWQQLAQAGILSAALPENDGGLQDSRALALLAERLGRSGAVSPFMSSAAVATSLLCRVPAADRFAKLRERLSSGSVIVAVDLPGVGKNDRSAIKLADSKVTGVAELVPFGAEADLIILVATDSSGEPSLLLVQKSDVSIEQSVIGIDGAPYATLRLDGVALPPESELARGAEAGRLIAWAIDTLVSMHCAEALGAMSMLVDLTRDYLKVRHQFGEPLSAFQVLRHRLVDMDMALTEARSVVECAAGLIEEDDAIARKQAVMASHFTVVRVARKVSQDSVQLHGGIGMADETPVGGFFRRLLTLPLIFGDEDFCAERYFADE